MSLGVDTERSQPYCVLSLSVWIHGPDFLRSALLSFTFQQLQVLFTTKLEHPSGDGQLEFLYL